MTVRHGMFLIWSLYYVIEGTDLQLHFLQYILMVLEVQLSSEAELKEKNFNLKNARLYL